MPRLPTAVPLARSSSPPATAPIGTGGGMATGVAVHYHAGRTEVVMDSSAPHLMRRFVNRDERPFRGIGWAVLLSLPVWLGMALLFV